jgi:predicted RNA-binding Zn ribbon-like protein
LSRVGPREPTSVALTGRRAIADLIWLANTRHGPAGHWFARVTHDEGDHDHLATGDDALRYLIDHDVEVPSDKPTPAELTALATIREMVRGLVEPAVEWTDGARRILDGASFRVARDGSLTSGATGWAAFIEDLMVPLLEVVRHRDRLSMCGNPHCRLVFLDASKSGTRRWCDDAGCGNRDRVKRHRRRQIRPALASS